VLTPLHHALFQTLKGLEMDCTFNQSKVKKYNQKWYNEGKPIFSVDLSAATDRLPLPLQAVIIAAYRKSIFLGIL